MNHASLGWGEPGLESRMYRVGLLVLLALMGGAAAAKAQSRTAADAAKDVVGAWEISNAERDRRCVITFSGDAVPGGLKLALDPGCATVFPMLKDVVVWTIQANGS